MASKSIERNIRKIRELKSYSQEFVANKLNLSVRAYSKIENGETQLTLNRLNQISEILEVTPQEVLGFDDQQIFNHCKQEGNIGINHINFPNELKIQFENRIKHLEEEIHYLRTMLEKELSN